MSNVRGHDSCIVGLCMGDKAQQKRRSLLGRRLKDLEDGMFCLCHPVVVDTRPCYGTPR